MIQIHKLRYYKFYKLLKFSTPLLVSLLFSIVMLYDTKIELF
jgi:hypothetical protein